MTDPTDPDSTACRAISDLALVFALEVIIVRRRAASAALGELSPNNGTGILVLIDGQHFIVTALHVLEWFDARADDGEDVMIQAGDLILQPEHALRFGDPYDFVMFPITPSQAELVGRQAYKPHGQWPPEIVSEGDFIACCGFPGDLREPMEGRWLKFKPWTLLVPVEATTRFGNRIICKLDRSSWKPATGEGLPPDSMDFGGMSGGPVFLLGKLSNPLIGVVEEATETLMTVHLLLPASAANGLRTKKAGRPPALG